MSIETLIKQAIDSHCPALTLITNVKGKMDMTTEKLIDKYVVELYCELNWKFKPLQLLIRQFFYNKIDAWRDCINSDITEIEVIKSKNGYVTINFVDNTAYDNLFCRFIELISAIVPPNTYTIEDWIKLGGSESTYSVYPNSDSMKRLVVIFERFENQLKYFKV